MFGFYLIGILGLALLMVVHEGGHFLVARRYGMRVTRFSIGFGPTIFRIEPSEGRYWFVTAGGRVRWKLGRHDPERHGPTVYQVAMIPFLAYVQIAGMNPLEDIDPDDKGSYANGTLPARSLAILGGPLANYLFASVLFFMSFFFGGRAVRSTEIHVVADRPAAHAGLRDGDRIVEIGRVKVDEWEAMAAIIAKNPGVELPVVVERGKERVELVVKPSSEQGKGRIGVGSAGAARRVPIPAGESLKLALTTPPLVVRDLIVGIGQLVTGKAEGELSGPAGIVKETARAAKSGWTDLLYFLGALSAYLGAFNMVPFPALDGGRLLFLSYEAVTRRRPNAKIEAQIHAVGLVMMLGLMLYVTFANDLGLGRR